MRLIAFSILVLALVVAVVGWHATSTKPTPRIEIEQPVCQDAGLLSDCGPTLFGS
jgi:hypothetical protein